MSTQQFSNPAQRAFAEAVAASLPPASVEAYKLDRLLELRAVIDSLRTERRHHLLRPRCGVISARE